MAKKIGIFENQQGVIDAVQELEKAGFTPGEMKILAKDAEHSRRIEAETDTHADEIRELEQANESHNGMGGIGFATTYGFGVPAVAGGFGLSGYGGAPFGGPSYALAAPYLFLNHQHESTFNALGLDTKETKLCSQAVDQGALALIVETDESKSLLDKDGGPDLSKLGIAEAVFRRCGASRIVDGS